MGPDEDIVLQDDNWDQCLYKGGMQLLVDSTEKVRIEPKPHMSAVRHEELPLSKLFHLYLVISGRNKTDPEIVHWIVDFLTGPKKVYLEYLMCVCDTVEVEKSGPIPLLFSLPCRSSSLPFAHSTINAFSCPLAASFHHESLIVSTSLTAFE